jgi:hypothetical protein
MRITAGNVVLISNTQTSTSTSTGALQVSGGVGVQGNVNVGGNNNITGNSSIGNTLTVPSINANLIYSLGNITITPAASSEVLINSTTALLTPAGNTAQRPTGVAGYVRYNFDISSLEYYNGVGWVPVTNTITGQNFTGDGTTMSFTLTQPATAIGIIVSINGTVQEPNAAYTVSGTLITFGEAPLPSDYVDIRFLASSITSDQDTTIINQPYVSINPGTSIVNSFSNVTYQSAKFTISSATAYGSHMAEVFVTQFNNTVIINTLANINTGSNTITYSANINNGTVNLLATPTTSSNIRIQSTYFAV